MVITADYIYTQEKLVAGWVLELDDECRVIALRPGRPREDVERFQGVLCPGFVNVHCHLELSAFRGSIPEGIGMGAFVKEVVTRRTDFSPSEERQAMHDALMEMYFTGTVAIGDICNSAATIEIKRGFPQVFSHSFIELIGLDGSRASEILSNGKKLMEAFSPLAASLSLHAPYSVSPALRDQVLAGASGLLSLHFMESEAELTLFQKNAGPLKDFFEEMGFPFQPFPESHPIAYLLAPIPSQQSMILVHNTQMTGEQLDDLAERFPHAWFCLCPRSNHYIHRSFPDINMFARHADRICIGTDSLASNRSLRMLDELYAIQQNFPSVSLHTLLKWACSQGAAALQQSDKFGSFIPGTTCGVNLIEHIDLKDLRLAPGSMVRKIC